LIPENRYLEIEYKHHRDSGYEELTVLIKSGLRAIIIPGLSFGVIIWAAQFASDQYLISSGLVGMRATLFPVMTFIVTPLLLLITGFVSEIIRNRGQDTKWTPWIPWTAGFLAMGTAFLLFRIVSSANQYVPHMAPGILPRLSYVTGDFVIYFPVLLVISTLFAFFSLAGGYGMHWKRVREEKRPVKRNVGLVRFELTIDGSLRHASVLQRVIIELTQETHCSSSASTKNAKTAGARRHTGLGHNPVPYDIRKILTQ
jgi:hypothetical protein